MTRPFAQFSVLLFSIVLGVCPVWADSLTVLEDTSGLKAAISVLDINVTGNEMAGMKVTVSFSDNTTQTGTWSAIGSTSGGIQFADWAFVQAGDTKLNTPWTLTNNSSLGIVGLSIDAISGNTVFDIVEDPMGTQVSGFGSLLKLLNGAGLDTEATFSQPVGLNGGTTCSDLSVQATCGDLFGNLNWVFLNNGELAPSQQFAFSVDTDRFEFPLPPSKVLPPPAAAVPEPNSLLLFGTGVIAFLCARKFWSTANSSL